MSAALLTRLGLWVIVAAAIAAFAPLPAELGVSAHAAELLVVGGGLAAIGFLLEGGVSRRQCQRCARRAARGSVLCSAHQRELRELTRGAAARNLGDNRHW